MNKHWIALLGILAFSITLAVVAGSQLGSTNALAIALGVGIGVAVGIPAGLVITLSVGRNLLSHGANREQDDTTTIIMPAQQAEMLMKMLNSRQQAAPEDFPMVAAEREFTVVGGAGLDEEPLD